MQPYHSRPLTAERESAVIAINLDLKRNQRIDRGDYLNLPYILLYKKSWLSIFSVSKPQEAFAVKLFFFVYVLLFSNLSIPSDNILF